MFCLAVRATVLRSFWNERRRTMRTISTSLKLQQNDRRNDKTRSYDKSFASYPDAVAYWATAERQSIHPPSFNRYVFLLLKTPCLACTTILLATLCCSTTFVRCFVCVCDLSNRIFEQCFDLIPKSAIATCFVCVKSNGHLLLHYRLLFVRGIFLCWKFGLSVYVGNETIRSLHYDGCSFF